MEFLPITLAGETLGQRHRHFNSLVRKAKESGVLIQAVVALPEESAIDRLFKIDLAIQLKHVDYILCNLKNDDMLYVSRALKSKWLTEHRDIINPKYLEEILFPEMITPAVTKMKHWLYINLQDPAMCQEFYQHYKENTFEFAVKFLSHCSHEFILEEVPKLLAKLSPHSLKVLCEKCPKAAKIFFDSLATDKDVKTRYLGQDRSYYNSVKCVLKLDADVFLDITEKYFNMNSFHKLSPLATDYILRYHKTRFTNKLELYVAYFLHIPTLADRLSVEECQEVVIKLARASYLQHWFQYKIVEPLIKRVSPDKRAAFKKRVFVDKDVGDCEDKWPYEIPVPPTISDVGLHIFDDQDFMAFTSPIFPTRAQGGGGCTLFVSAFASASRCPVLPEGLTFMNMVRVKTDLDRLFDEFRFIGFERALHELGQRLGATSSTDRRRDIFLVLVSKTGGRIDAVSALLRLASRHRNEPSHTRASVLRSLVKRAKVWRLPADVWQHLLDYGQGLGLDGSKPEAACREGLHAVVIRQLLGGECEQTIREAFMKDFSTLVEYSLKADERERVAKGLQNMLADTTETVEPFVAAQRLRQLLDVLKIYRIRVEPKSPVVKAVVALAQRDALIARPLLEHLYNEKIARRELLRFNMEFRCDEAALLNALRHDPSVLDFKRVADTLAGWHNWDTGYRSRACRHSYPKIFGRGPTQSTNFGTTIAQPLGLGSTAAPVPGLTFSRPANQLTGFNFGIPAGTHTEAVGSTAPTTGFTFGSSTAHAAKNSSSSGATTPLMGFNFGIPAAQSTIASDSAPSTGFTLSSATALPSDVCRSDNSSTPRTGIIFGNTTIPLAVGVSSSDSSTAPAIGISFDSPASQLQVVGSSANQQLVSSSPDNQTAVNVNPDQITGFGNPTDQPKVDDSSTVQPTAIGGSTVHPTTFNSGVPQTMGFGGSSAQTIGFGGSSSQPMGFGGSSAQTMGFGGSSAQTMGFGGSSAQPMGFGGSSAQTMGFGGSSAQTMGFGGSSAQPMGFSGSSAQTMGFGGSSAQTMGFGGSSAQPMGFGGSSAQTMGFGGSSAQTMGFGGSSAQPMGFGGSSAQTMGFGGSSAQTMGFGGSSAQPMGFGGSSAQTMGFGGSSAQPMGFGGSSAQTMGFGGSSAQTMGFGGSSAQPMGFGGSSAQTMGFGGSCAQPMGFSGFAPHRFPFHLFSARQSNFDTFISKLGIYFDQKQDLSTHLRTALKEKIAQGRYVKPARPLASLLGNSFERELSELDAAGKEKLKLAAALRACAHRARPVVNLAEWGWRKAGVKAVATRAMRCRKIERAALTHTLAVERRTVTVALVLSMRPPGESLIEIFKSLAKLRPAKALSAALPYFRRHGDRADLRVWDIVKPLLSSVKLENHARLRNLLTNTEWIPTTIKPDYCITLYHALHKICKYSDQTLLRDLSKLLHKCDESIESILLQMLDDNDNLVNSAVQYPSIYVRYLLLSRNEEDVEHRFVNIGNRFIAQLDKLRSEKDFQFKRQLDQILESLKYNSAFLDTKFSSCLSVIERISAWLQTFMPKEEYFKMYTKIRLTMLYFKAVRQSMKQMPEVFSDPKRRKSEGVEAVGFMFGRYIMKEVAELVSTYFDSIIELYTGALMDYLNCNFLYGTSKNKFIGFVLKGILKEAEGVQRRLALYIFRQHYLGIEDSVRKEIEELMIKDQSIEILVHAETFNQTVPIIPYHNIRIRN